MTAEQLIEARRMADAASSLFRLPLGAQTWRGSAGDFAGNGVGSSMDFQDQRLYAPGDDPRHINWQAYARTGQYTMKLYREEVRPLIDLIVDVSQSMFFEPQKAQRSAELIYLMALLSERSGASLHITFISGKHSREISLQALLGHHWWDIASSLQEKDPNSAPTIQSIPLRSTALRIFVSDLLYPGNPEEQLRGLTARKGRLLTFSPYLLSEEQPDWSGNFEFIDAESQARHRCRIQTSQLNAYRKAYAQHFTLWTEQARKHQAILTRVGSEPELVNALKRAALPVNALEIRN